MQCNTPRNSECSSSFLRQPAKPAEMKRLHIFARVAPLVLLFCFLFACSSGPPPPTSNCLKRIAYKNLFFSASFTRKKDDFEHDSTHSTSNHMWFTTIVLLTPASFFGSKLPVLHVGLPNSLRHFFVGVSGVGYPRTSRVPARHRQGATIEKHA